MRLFHFSDDSTIATCEPRPVLVPSKRVPGMKWLNGPLVWAVDESVDFMHLFPATLPAHPHMGNRANEQRGQDRAAAYVEQAGIWTRMFDGRLGLVGDNLVTELTTSALRPVLTKPD